MEFQVNNCWAIKYQKQHFKTAPNKCFRSSSSVEKYKAKFLNLSKLKMANEIRKNRRERKQDLEIVCVEAQQSFLSLPRQNECKTLAATDFLKCNFHMMEVLSYHCLAYMPTDLYEVASGFAVGCV